MGLQITDDTLQMHVMGYLVETKYRITVAEWSLLTFLALAEIVLFWCFFVLIYASLLDAAIPNSSDYLDWDVMAKCVGTNKEFEELMRGTGDATGNVVSKRIRGYRLFVKSISDDDGAVGRTVLRVGKKKESSRVWPSDEKIRDG